MWAALLIAIGSVVYLVREQRTHQPVFGNSVYSEPMQDESAVLAPFTHRGYRIAPVARFEIKARLLSRETYRVGREADLSPVDYALGWNRMSEDAVLEKLSISQGGRFYAYRWSDEPPIPAREIARSSANMHLVPANADVKSQLESARPGSIVHLRGWLIDIDADDGWRWRTSRTREDTGAGACEVIWVESVSIEERST